MALRLCCDCFIQIYGIRISITTSEFRQLPNKISWKKHKHYSQINKLGMYWHVVLSNSNTISRPLGGPHFLLHHCAPALWRAKRSQNTSQKLSFSLYTTIQCSVLNAHWWRKKVPTATHIEYRISTADHCAYIA